MTIANVLELNGLNVARAVSASGRIIFKTSTARELTGAPLKPHTFHGGTAAPTATSVPAHWWLDDGWASERAEMAKWFPGFRAVTPDDATPPAWVGVIDTGRGKFKVRIQHRDDHGLPHVIPLSPTRLGRSTAFRRWEPAPHTFLNGWMCVAAEEDWDPASDTAITVVGWAAHWCAMYAEWFATGHWVSEGYHPDAP